MSSNFKQNLTMPFWCLCILFAFSSLGWFIASFLVGNISDDSLTKTISELLMTIFKTVFIGTSVGIAFNYYLKKIYEKPSESETMLDQSGITRIYPNRKMASVDFLKLVQDPRNKHIDIVGISMRDFLIGGGTLHNIWQAICQRLREEHESKLDINDKIRIRVLLLNPISGEGLFRHKVEIPTLGQTGLNFDIPAALEEINRVQKIVLKDEGKDLLQVRLYEHCPFAFIFATDSDIFIEQYYYRDHKKPEPLPIIRYSSNLPQFQQLCHSFNTVWEHAGIGKKFELQVGTAKAIENANIKNIFRREDRHLLGRCQIEELELTPADSIIDILSITGKFYVSHPIFLTLKNISSPKDKQDYSNVRFALINPISQQAILRAVADSSAADKIKETLVSWSWEKHKATKLYTDIEQTIRDINFWKESGCSFELRLYSCAISCALLITPNSVFIEQYVYGRSEEFKAGMVLGGEYPTIQFDFSSTDSDTMIEKEILNSTFNVIWDSYSIDYENFSTQKQEVIFNKNLQLLLEEMNGKKNDTTKKKVSNKNKMHS